MKGDVYPAPDEETDMKNPTARTPNELEQLRLPELQARFREVTGETSRSPNRTFLIRRIEEALAARAEAAAPPPAPLDEVEHEVAADIGEPSKAANDASPPKPQRGRFATMTIEELQARSLEVVGRATGSDDKRYLTWKIREAEKGRINVGPRSTRAHDGEPLDVKIFPLRLEANVADKMDEAWRAKGIKSRMEFFRGAIGHYLAHLGAGEAAAMFAKAGAAGG